MVEPARYSKELILLTEVSIIFGPAAAHVIVSAVTIALGAFIAASPRQAAGDRNDSPTWLLRTKLPTSSYCPPKFRDNANLCSAEESQRLAGQDEHLIQRRGIAPILTNGASAPGILQTKAAALDANSHAAFTVIAKGKEFVVGYR
jgi:hypothetical protein